MIEGHYPPNFCNENTHDEEIRTCPLCYEGWLKERHEKYLKAIKEPLEIDVDVLRQQVLDLRERNAALENIAKAISDQCLYRINGICVIECAGTALCSLDGLELVHRRDAL